MLYFSEMVYVAVFSESKNRVHKIYVMSVFQRRLQRSFLKTMIHQIKVTLYLKVSNVEKERGILLMIDLKKNFYGDADQRKGHFKKKFILASPLLYGKL